MASHEMEKACIVGAGPGGLALARAFKNLGIKFDVFEKHSDVGGLWDIENEGSPMYESAHFISSKTKSHYAGFPMPEHYPDYPSNNQILSYLRDFAKAYNLYEDITFNTSVTATKFVDDMWHVTLSNGETRPYRWLVCVTGTNWIPHFPSWANDPFDGEIRHARDFRQKQEFAGKRVLVVGAGNSGCDIACDAAIESEAAFISLRRGYHFVPKHIMGKPTDVFATEGPKLPVWMAQKVFSGLLRFINGDITRYGLPAPDHKVFESHPIMNTQLLHYLGHGDIRAKGDVKGLDGKDVVFVDGSRERIDVVLCATGYDWQIPYVDASQFVWNGRRPENYLHMFSKKNPQLFSLGYTETNGGIYKHFDDMADIMGRVILEQAKGGAGADKFQQRVTTHKLDLSGGVNFVSSGRHANYANLDALVKELGLFRKHMGWKAFDPDALAPETFPKPLKLVA